MDSSGLRHNRNRASRKVFRTLAVWMALVWLRAFQLISCRALRFAATPLVPSMNRITGMGLACLYTSVLDHPGTRCLAHQDWAGLRGLRLFTHYGQPDRIDVTQATGTAPVFFKRKLPELPIRFRHCLCRAGLDSHPA